MIEDVCFVAGDRMLVVASAAAMVVMVMAVVAVVVGRELSRHRLENAAQLPIAATLSKISSLSCVCSRLRILCGRSTR